MKPIRIAGSLVLGTVLVAACGERNTPTAPLARELVTAAALVDRPYTWSFKCNGDGGIWATWSWTENGTVIASLSADCTGSSQLSGTGMRPVTANGFTATVAGLGGGNTKSWTFDPAGPFKANLSGSDGGGGGKLHCFFGCLNKESGQLSVDS